MENLSKTLILSCDLKSINKVSKMSSALRQLGGFLEPALTFLNCHFADYYLKSYWNAYLPPKLRLDLESKSLEQVKNCVRDLVQGTWKNYPEYNKEILDFQHASTLEQLVVSIGKLRLSEQNLCTNYRTLQENRMLLKERFPKLFVDLEFDNFMSSKKMHEVLQFSEFIACTCEGVSTLNALTNCDKFEYCGGVEVKDEHLGHVVDVGSGKGYLSSFLALYYDLKVLAIDASATNTEGCEKRSAKLDQTWPHLIRRARERRDTGSATNHGKNWRKKLTRLGISMEEYQKSLQKEVQYSEGNVKSVTEMITTKTDMQRMVDATFGVMCEGQNETKSCTNAAKDGICYGMIGLHTCGNLGANILKLFLHNEKAHFICVVPCCYNLVREDESLYPETVFYGSKFGTEEEAGGSSKKKIGPWPDGSIGFPLSDELKNYNCGRAFVVGRNARMLSAYSLPRMMNNDGGQLEVPPVLYFRALLQVFLQRHGLLPDNHEESDIRVGRMTKKCSSFKDYVIFALKKLEVIKSTDIDCDILNDGSIEDIEATFASPEMIEKFHKYYLLRTLFSSVVEDLILLDRLVFLLERESIQDAHIVQLFDPALSPRSHAIVALKK